MKKPHQTYQRVGIQTADPVKIIVMLYDGMMKHLNQAIDDFAAKRGSEGSNHIKRALDIIHYLYNSLDFEKGGEIAVNLARIYDYARDTLSMANIYADGVGIRKAMNALQPLHEGWQELAARSTDGTLETASNSQSVTSPEDSPRISVVG